MTKKLIFRQETSNDFQEIFEVNQIAFGQDALKNISGIVSYPKEFEMV